MKIAYIGAKALPAEAGADRVVEAIVRRIAGRHQVTVYCSSRLVPPEATYPDVELVRVGTLRGKHTHATSLFLMAAVHAVARRQFDLVHVHNVEACLALPLLKLKYKVVATSHGQAYARDKWGRLAKLLIRAADWPYIRLADCPTSVSGPLAEYYARRYGRDVHYIPNGIGPEDAHVDLAAAEQLLRGLKLDPGRYILFAAGRIIPTKGASLLLRAYRDLATDLNLLMVGDSAQVPAYQKRLRELGDSRVVFAPPVDRTVLLGLVRLAHLFVFPSTVEAMSMMLLEAASQGAPIVSSDIPENTAVLPQAALYFTSGDVTDLRDKLDWALRHPAEMRALGAKAAASVAESYRWDSVVGQYERLYEAVVSNNHAATL